MAFILLRTFDNSIEAHLLKSKLESEGIECYIFHENTATLTPIAIGAISFKVYQKDFPKAYEIMMEMQRLVPKDKNGNIISCPECHASKLIIIKRKQKNQFKGFFDKIRSFFNSHEISVVVCEGCKKEFDPSDLS